MFARFDAINIWLSWIYDERNEHKAAHAFAQTLLKTSDPRVRCMLKHTLAYDRQTVLHMQLFQRN